MDHPAIEVRDLSVSYGSTPVLVGVRLSMPVGAGEIMLLLGALAAQADRWWSAWSDNAGCLLIAVGLAGLERALTLIM